MNRIRFYAGMMMALLLASCNEQNPQQNVAFTASYLDHLDASDYFESVDYVFLDGGDDALFIEPEDLEFFEGKWFILDQNLKKVLCFSESGQHLFNIDDVGRGPGEYSLPETMVIRRDLREIWLECRQTSRILQYDLNGHLIGEKKFTRLGYDLAALPDGRVLAFNSDYHHLSMHDSVPPGLFFLEEPYRPARQILSLHPWRLVDELVQHHNLSMKGDTCFFLHSSDTLLAYGPDMKPRIAGVFDFGKYHLPAYLQNMPRQLHRIRELEESGKILWKEKLVPTDSWFFFHAGMGTAYWYAVADRQTRRVAVSQGFVNPLGDGPFAFPIARKNDRELVGYISADYLVALKESLARMQTDDWADELERMNRFIQTAMKKTGNVLVILKLKNQHT